MKKIFILFVVLGLLASCTTSKRLPTITTKQEIASARTQNDGSSFEKAIVINIKTESKGVAAEYQWLAQNYPGSKSQGQSLMMHNKKPYDVIKIKTREGKEVSVYFDISNFFGKY